MSYVAAVCGKGAEVNQVKEQLLQSNPVLEGKNLSEYVWAYCLCVCVLVCQLSCFGKIFLVMFHCYLVSKTIGDALCGYICKVFFSCVQVFLTRKWFPSWRKSSGSWVKLPSLLLLLSEGLPFPNPALMMLLCIKRLDFSPSDSFPSKSYYYSL